MFLNQFRLRNPAHKNHTSNMKSSMLTKLGEFAIQNENIALKIVLLRGMTMGSSLDRIEIYHVYLVPVRGLKRLTLLNCQNVSFVKMNIPAKRLRKWRAEKRHGQTKPHRSVL